MLTKNRVIALAVLTLVLAGGSGVRSEAVPDMTIDVWQLGESCQYWAPSPPSGETSRLHSGLVPEVVVADPDALRVVLACTDRPTCEQGMGPPDLDCFLGGEHYLLMQAENPTDGCVRFTVDGLRGAAASVRVGGVKQPLQYLAVESGGVDSICGVQAGQQVELRMMMCPSALGHSVDLFWSILGTARVFGTVEGDSEWDYRYDHNEDGQIDLGDIFAAMFRFSLHCPDFDY
jgi:hypothetical protein